jgi:peroxiredoxin
LPSTIAEVHRQYGERGLAVVAVNIQESKAKVARWIREKKLAVPIALDADGAVTAAYRITATPTVYLVGRDGRLVGLAVGTRAWTSERGRRLLEALMTP